ncbi:hypothetical protein COU80_00895 [Candidatus Peregrinibacteria bacterium CG10_big_fil_rev_8_21_14_0_10_55_24]|nr:MAG: hypothetical protein COU80_00895 [Candidatus Peregrinibacteria bacterium CG10_big_fil_rev_8_21_14_0_10_55_24]
MEKRIYVIGDQELLDVLTEPMRKRTELVQIDEEWPQVERNALIIIVNTSMAIDQKLSGALNPALCLERTLDLALHVLRQEQDPPHADRPYVPPTTVHCDPHAHSSLLSFFGKGHSSLYRHPNNELLSTIVAPQMLDQYLHARLRLKLLAEQHTRCRAETAAFEEKPTERWLKKYLKGR